MGRNKPKMCLPVDVCIEDDNPQTLAQLASIPVSDL